MRHYSFIVVAPREVPLREYNLYLDPGRNVFNLMVSDLAVFQQALRDAGVKIVQENCLDEHEPVPPESFDDAGPTPPWEAV